MGDNKAGIFTIALSAENSIMYADILSAALTELSVLLFSASPMETEE